MKFRLISGLLVLFLIIAAVVQYMRPIPNPTLRLNLPKTVSTAGKSVHLPWPSSSQAQAAVVIPGVGTMGSHGPITTPMPIGSITKVMTAYLVLKKYPLSRHQSGPSLTITAKDVAEYQKDVKGQQSVLPITVGEKLTEKQLLQGLLIASGNNVATLLARWVSGSQAAFVKQMNLEAKKLGMTNTTYVGPVGMSTKDVSTVMDQIKLAEATMKYPVFAHISAQPQATLPYTGTVYNFDSVLGQAGIIGVKTGSTIYTGGCFIFAAAEKVKNHTVTVYGGILGQPGTKHISQLDLAMQNSVKLIKAAVPYLTYVHPVKSQTTIAQATAPWLLHPVSAFAQKGVTMLSWPGLKTKYKLTPVWGKLPIASGAKVGSLTIQVGKQKTSVNVLTTAAITAPSLKWRLLQP